MRLTLDRLDVLLDRARILHAVDLDVAPGSLVGLVGPNGSGKSTLLRAVYRALRPASGAVLVGGDDVWALSARTAARRTAAVLQERDAATAGMTAAEVVALGRTPHHGLLGRPTAADRAAVETALVRCGAGHLAHRAVSTLSGGERQRVLLARALAQDPQLLVLDEVTNHLDIHARFELLELIRSTGLTTVAVLHDLDLAARFCDRLVVLDRGTVHSTGPVLDVLTPGNLAEVFRIVARAEAHEDGIIRLRYAANPLVEPSGADEDGDRPARSLPHA